MEKFGYLKDSENPFSLSIGDLMAALLLIFVLLLSSTLLSLQKEFEKKSNVAERYREVKENLYEELDKEFKDDLPKWNAVLDPKELSLRFKEPDVLFELNQTSLKPLFKKIIDDFFPRYIKVLTSPQFISTIEEIRIEGHTDSSGPTRGLDPLKDYFYNMALSQGRTRSVLEYSLNRIENEQIKSWVQKRLTANGLSSSKLIVDPLTGIEDRTASRRVEFKVRTNAEEQIQEILKYAGKSDLK